MRNLLLSILLFVGSIRYTCGQVPSRNDHIFPAAAQAKPYINYDSKGFLVNGKRTFIVSAGMEYARVPRGLWRDRLLRLKRAGFNAVEMYTFWNFHEAKEGQFNFTGDHDLNAYLKLIKSLNMYAIVRVGPYYCGEWNMGGYPIWLKFKPGLRVREDNGPFLAAVDKFFNKLMPIVSANQIHRGGSVIMVQLENEHRAAWGTVTPNGYFKHLIAKTTSLGLQVPYFFSGLHPGNDPAADEANLDDPKRPNPWFSTEYWGVWITNYGPQPDDSTLYDRRTWKIIAHGGNGYNLYMAHGGTNFDYNNDREMAASYDYGAAVGQAGDLRPIYYSFKRANWFARSFQQILANSSDDPDNKITVSDTAIKVTSRKSPAGTIAFLDNQDSVTHTFRFDAPAGSRSYPSANIKLDAGEIFPVVQNYALTPAVKLAWAPTRIYGIIPQGKTTTIVVNGKAGTMAKLYFSTTSNSAGISNKQNFVAPNGQGIINFTANVPADAPAAYSFTAGGQRVRIIVVNDDLAKRAWFVEAGTQTNVVIGPDYAEEIIANKNKSTLITERSWAANDFPIWIYKPAGTVVRLDPKWPMVKRRGTLPLGEWQVKDAAHQAQPGFDDSNWKASTDPLQMGADGDITADAWYRTKIKVQETGTYMLRFKNAPEMGAVFLDGKRVDTAAVFAKTVSLDLKKEVWHSVAIFTAHTGRNKLIFKVGVIDTLDVKGLSGPVSLQKADGTGSITPIINWRMKGGPGNPFDANGWQPITSAKTNSPKFYHTILNLPAFNGSKTVWRVNTTSLSSGSVWFNGHNLGRYPEKIKIWGHYIPDCWFKAGENTLVIYDENGTLPTNVEIQAEAEASRERHLLVF